MKKYGSLLQELMDLTIKHLMIFLFGTLEWTLKTHLKITTTGIYDTPFSFFIHPWENPKQPEGCYPKKRHTKRSAFLVVFQDLQGGIIRNSVHFNSVTLTNPSLADFQ